MLSEPWSAELLSGRNLTFSFSVAVKGSALQGARRELSVGASLALREMLWSSSEKSMSQSDDGHSLMHLVANDEPEVRVLNSDGGGTELLWRKSHVLI